MCLERRLNKKVYATHRLNGIPVFTKKEGENTYELLYFSQLLLSHSQQQELFRHSEYASAFPTVFWVEAVFLEDP